MKYKIRLIFRVFLLLLLAVLVCSSVFARETPDLSNKSGVSKSEVKKSLEELIHIAFKNNPALVAAKKVWKAIIEKYPQVTSYDDPVFQYTYFVRSVETRVGPQNQKFGISQKIPYPGKLSLKGEIVSREVVL